ncbi:HTH-type transcriptional regulator Mce2R [Crateriforma conspicua]|nr:HTH-type transcriptional regulator Mce2R [Crateriforma conspicua]
MEIPRMRRNLCGQVVHDLGFKILAGQVKPGEALPQEPTLCEQLGVSRTVVREAIKSLAAKGLVESRPKRGTIVRPSADWNYLDSEVLAWHASADGDGQHLRFLTEFRLTVEPAAAALAAKRASEDQLDRIRAALEKMAANTDSVEAFKEADLRFHTEILHATGNPFFSPVAGAIAISLATSLKVTNRQPADNPASVPLHRDVMDAICRRDADAAREAMHCLLADAKRRIESASDATNGTPSA